MTPALNQDRARERAPLARQLALLCVATLLAFALVETVLRACVPQATPIRFTQDVAELEALGNTATEELLQSDPELFWALVPNRTRPAGAGLFRGRISNAQGLREEHEIALPKPEGELRILFLGDSCTFGTGLELEQGFVQLVEHDLHRRFPDRAIECINAGVPGYTLFQGWRVLAMRGLELEPDLVVVTFGWNEASLWDSTSDLEHYARWRATQPPGPLAASRLLRELWSLWQREPPPTSGEPRARLEADPRKGDEYSAVLQEVRTLTDALGADLSIVVWPVRYNLDPDVSPQWRSRFQKANAAFAQQNLAQTWALIDLVPVVRTLADEHAVDEIFQDQVHATALTHASYADAIAARLARWVEVRSRP